MDKDSYETYEYLPDTSTGSQSNQFYVVQDDNTFLINRPIQYVTQVQNVKEVLGTVQPGCTVYDVSSQQFYVDMDNNSELTAPEELILPERSNNIYANNYLLQPVCNASESMETDFSIEHNMEQEMAQTKAEPHIDKEQQQNHTLTEITLSDEQYKMWEQNGWILLEMNEKIFYLDTLGLHDISNDESMIKKLRSLLNSSSNKQNNISLMKSENIDPSNKITLKQQFEGSVLENKASESETKSEDLSENVKPSSEKVKDEMADIPLYVSATENNTMSTEFKLEEHRQTTPKFSEKSTIRLKANYTFKNVPEKIYLGKTSKGKRLVAKVVKAKGVQIMRSPIRTGEGENAVSKVVQKEESGDDDISVSVSSNRAQEVRLQKLFEEWVCALAEEKAPVEAIEETRHLVAHLLNLPAIRPFLLNRQLVVTKVIKLYNDTSSSQKGNQPYMVAGVVADLNGELVFQHEPNMLRDVLENDGVRKYNEETSQAQPNRNVLHIHLSETRTEDNTRHTSMLLKKRILPQSKRPKKHSSSSVFACGTCAAIYATEYELREHQETHSLDSEDTLTIDTGSSTNNLYEVIDDGGKLYACTQCDLQFNRLTNCEAHVRVHQSLRDVLNNKDNGLNNVLPDTLYRCKMCPAMYRHTATLAKHIANKHIKVE